jgi:hypothetical protein
MVVCGDSNETIFAWNIDNVSRPKTLGELA